MDPVEIKLIEKLLKDLVDFAHKGDARNMRLANLGLIVVGPPALNRITRSLEGALREFDEPASAAVAKTILDIWEINDGLAVQMNKDKMRRLLSRLPRMPPKIKEALSQLRNALRETPDSHAEKKFLRGPAQRCIFTADLKRTQMRVQRNMN